MITAICPFCKSRIKGNNKVKFFCPKCFIIFTKDELKSIKVRK